MNVHHIITSAGIATYTPPPIDPLESQGVVTTHDLTAAQVVEAYVL